ncbi:hypothetical protein LTR56_007442 [Elasticomyces elasticus]|nr:hypothetical protein LTR56_007442 [Elasticomyces elasticus]KAK3668019.1 hypothetical protein LTR22_001086 [Elasticomyces elasticus]KAK4925167.1 hypothetical protein LTR49_007704 [Elasticomyces elasticus]KAK5767659.1 hypothetical protein LTS12_002160 [Elasticomyces elasticus]
MKLSIATFVALAISAHAFPVELRNPFVARGPAVARDPSKYHLERGQTWGKRDALAGGERLWFKRDAIDERGQTWGRRETLEESGQSWAKRDDVSGPELLARKALPITDAEMDNELSAREPSTRWATVD